MNYNIIIIIMSYTNSEYQSCINQSLGPGQYKLNQPINNGCYAGSPDIRIQKQNWYQRGGDATYDNIVDVNSELKNITRKLYKCPNKRYLPQCDLMNCACKFGYPCGSGVMNDCYTNGERCPDNKLYHPPDCDNDFLKSNYTRLNNPCQLKEIGINRWQWLCKNPQDNVNIPFDHFINTRTLIKDNHRPCVPNPTGDYYQYQFESKSN